MLEALETFKENRCRQIDEVMAELCERAESLKEHINA